MEMECGALGGGRLTALGAFLTRQGLEPPRSAPEYTVNLLEDGVLLATGSLNRNVLQYIAVSPERQGDGLCAAVVSRLVHQAVAKGWTHLLLCTKPENRALFRGTGFYPVAETASMLLMENVRNGAARFVADLPRPPSPGGTVGAIVANCDPFTRGHRHLAETAAARCGFLYVFILSEDQSFFSAKDRLALARRNLADLPNAVVCPTGDYLISAATFPTYFLKDQTQAAASSAELDLKIFADCFARPLGITRRFMGEEPLCPVTRAYNLQMLELLPPWGVEPVVIPRLARGGAPVSAGQVRRMLRSGAWEDLRPLVTEITFQFLNEEYRHGDP